MAAVDPGQCRATCSAGFAHIECLAGDTVGDQLGCSAEIHGERRDDELYWVLVNPGTGGAITVTNEDAHMAESLVTSLLAMWV
jgi:hypothetical protein